MSKIDKSLIQEVRDRTGLGMIDCKNALEQSNGNVDAAIDLLRKKGSAVAIKRSSKDTAEGIVHTYIHPGNRVGVMLELNCETDFVARTDVMAKLAQDICMHIAALRPLYLAPADVDATFLAHEKNLFQEQMIASGKPAAAIEKIVEGKVLKLYSDICLLKQPFVKNDKVTVEELVQEAIAKTGENIKIRRFARFEVGV